jgi:hypothetical protein
MTDFRASCPMYALSAGKELCNCPAIEVNARSSHVLKTINQMTDQMLSGEASRFSPLSQSPTTNYKHPTFVPSSVRQQQSVVSAGRRHSSKP